MLRPPLRGEIAGVSEKKKRNRKSPFLVTYELAKPQDFGGLASLLNGMNGTKILDRTWIVMSEYDRPNVIFEKLKPRLDAGDRLFVTRIQGDVSYSNLLCGDARAQLFGK